MPARKTKKRSQMGKRLHEFETKRTAVAPAPASVPAPAAHTEQPEPEQAVHTTAPEPEMSTLMPESETIESLLVDSNSDQSLSPAFVSVADLAASIESSTEFHSVVAGLAEKSLDRLLFDVTSDNRVVLSLTGSSLAQYKSDWLAYNVGRVDRVPFSKYLARRVASCSSHSSDKSLYFRSEDVAALERLADDNFQSSRDVLSWIERTLSISVLDDDGNPLQLRPIPPEVWERIESRKWDEETPAMYIDRVIRRSVGAD